MASRPSLGSKFAVLVCIIATTATSGALGAKSDPAAGDNEASPREDSKTTAEASESPEPEAKTDSKADSSGDIDEEVVTNSPEKKTVSGAEKSTSHQGQFSLRLALGGAYRIVMRYDDSPPCATTPNDQGDPRTLCGYSAPLQLDTAIGYAPLAGVEPFLWGRFGLAKETVSNTTPLVVLGAGVRLYTMSDSDFKFFIEPAVGVELDKETSPKTNHVATRQPAQYKQDFIMRLTVGPQYDFHRNVGAYVAVGLTAGVLRSLQSWMDVHAGLQARFP
jgi:hypothetical protein